MTGLQDRHDINPVNQNIFHNPACRSSGHLAGRDILKYKELTETIIGCAYSVYNKMGFGLPESV